MGRKLPFAVRLFAVLQDDICDPSCGMSRSPSVAKLISLTHPSKSGSVTANIREHSRAVGDRWSCCAWPGFSRARALKAQLCQLPRSARSLTMAVQRLADGEAV